MLLSRLKAYFNIPEVKYSANEIYHWLWVVWKGNRLQAILNALVGLLQVAVSLSTVWAMQRAIDVASHAIEGDLFQAVMVMGMLILCEFSLYVASIWIQNILGIKAQNRMQQMLLGRILNSEWKGRENLHSGDLLNRLEFDVSNVVSFLTETIPSSLSTLALFIGSFCYLLSMDWKLALITVAIIPIFTLFSKIYVRKMRALTRDVRSSDSNVQSVLQETIQYKMLIKTLEGVAQAVHKLEMIQSELRQKVVSKTKFSIFSNLTVAIGFSLGYLIAFAWAAVRLSMNTLTFGGMTAFLQLVNRIQNPARQLTRLVPAFVSVFTAAERLMEIEEERLELQGEPIKLAGVCGIRIKNVTFKYSNEENNILDNLSFDFYPKSCTALLGETGSGKTTLVRMILALIEAQSGQVEIYNETETQALSALHRTNIVYVPQGNTLMSGSIRDNLRLGKLNATDEEMRAVLKKSCADFVFDLPQGLDTLCSEQGGGLSEGQAQRIAIARSLLREGTVMIFDEATSALDPETEKTVLRNILEKNEQTVIFITHRPAVIDYCSQTLKIERL